MEGNRVPENNLLLVVTAFISGMSIMALEMSASRLLAPYFGTSLFVWTNIIGITMISLSIGYYYGGRIADGKTDSKPMFRVLLGTGSFAVLIPFFAPIVMSVSQGAVSSGSAGVFYGSMLGTILLFAPPITALGGVSPYVIRLSTSGDGSYGTVAGRVFAVSTVGSILGTFLPVLLLIPIVGTKQTILIFGVALIVLGLIGLGKQGLSLVALLLLFTTFLVGSARPGEGVIFEKESVHNYIQVVEHSGVRYLKLNEGYAYHSIYNPGSVTVNGVWDYFNILPLLNRDAKDALIIGLAGGTVAREYRFFYPDLAVDGVELDSEIIKAGNTFFDMAGANLKTYNMDGRSFLKTTDKRYDIVIIDAYKQPYIPFHLTTQEFFTEVRSKLRDGGIVAINVATTGSDSKVQLMLENTLASVYENVYTLDVPNTLNSIIIASDKELFFEFSPENPVLESIASRTRGRVKKVEFDPAVLVLTDDRAPVEMYTDMMILDYIRSQDTRGFTEQFE